MLEVNALESHIDNRIESQGENSSTSSAFFVDKNEKRRLRWLIFALLLATTLPYLWALAITPIGFGYTGLLFSPDDQNVHLMWAKQAAQGHFFMQDLFTTEHLSTGEKPLFANFLTTFIGALSWPLFSLIFAYHVVRLTAGALCLWCFYQLAAQLTNDKRIRFFATFLAAFSSGGGWLRDTVPFLSSRIWMDRPDNENFAMMPEGFAFPSLFIFPINAAALALLALVYLCVLRAQNGEKRALKIGFGAAFLLSNIHTYDALPLGATLLIWALFCGLKNKKKAFAPLIIASGALPPLLYQIYVFKNSSEFQLKAITITAPPPLPDVLLSYAPLLLLAIFGMWTLRQNQAARLLMLWSLVTLIMIYAPLSFGRKMIEGFHLPLCFFAAIAVFELLENRTFVLQRTLATFCGLLLCLSSLQFISWCLADAPKSIVPYRGNMPPLYLSVFDGGVLDDLRAQYQKDKFQNKPPAAILSLAFVGNYIPQKTGYHAFLGHWAETLDIDRKSAETNAFYQGQMSRADALDWLHKNHIRYVFYGFYEAGIFQSSKPLYDLLGAPLFSRANKIENSNNPPAMVFEVPDK